MNALRLLLAVSLCVASGARAAELKGNQTDHDVCIWNCAIEDYATVTKTFSRLVSEEKKRLVNLIIDAYTDSKSSFCKNSTAHNSTDFYPSWAVDEREPYLYLPSDLTGLLLSPSPFQFKKRMTIDLDCNGKVRESAPGELNETSPLESAVTRCLMQDLIREEGVLCFPVESQDDIDRLYQCCHFDQSTSAITCNLIQSKIAHWIQALRTFWQCVLFIIAAYLPAVLCLFPSLPKVTDDGTPCIELKDPSPAALRTLLVKAFVPRNTDSLLDKARLFFLKVVLIPWFLIAPVILTSDDFIYNGLLALALLCNVFCLIPFVCELYWPSSAELSACTMCSDRHLDGLEAVKVHVTDQLLMSWKRCRQFSKYYFKKAKSLICFDPKFQSPATALWSVSRIFFSALLFPFASIGLLVGCTFVILVVFSGYCPLVTLWLFYLSRVLRDFRSGLVITRTCSKSVAVYFSGASRCSIELLALFTSHAWVILLSYLIMAVIDFADTVFPILALSVLILYYLHKFYSSFSEKYQLLKIKLFLGIRQHHDSGGELLLVKSKTGAMAIPEDLYNFACRKLEMPMSKTFWQAFMKMACLMVFVLSFSCTIMIFGARAGIAPLTKMVAIFLAGFLPQILSLVTAGGQEETLREYDMEMKLKDVITDYSNGERDISTHGETETLV